MTEPITLEKLPYHFCAVTGNVNLAAFLYLRQIPCTKGITIANFAADGKEGTTPWKKPVILWPADVANMAGKQSAPACNGALAKSIILYTTYCACRTQTCSFHPLSDWSQSTIALEQRYPF